MTKVSVMIKTVNKSLLMLHSFLFIDQHLFYVVSKGDLVSVEAVENL